MELDFQNLKVRGFDTTDDQMKNLQEELNWVAELAPCDSNVDLVITKNNHFFRGIVTIKSAVKNFQTIVLENSLEQVMSKVFSQIHSDLKKWKKERFNFETKPTLA